MANNGGFKEYTAKGKGDGAPARPMRREGGLRPYEAPGHTGAGAGGLRPFEPKASASRGGLRDYVPKEKTARADSAVPSAAPAGGSAPAPAAAGGKPCVGCAQKLSVGAGQKAGLRTQLINTINVIALFALNFFDALIWEVPADATSGAPAPPAPAAPEPRRKAGPGADPSPPTEPASHWQGRGLGVELREGLIVVTSVVGSSPAGRSGIEVGDVVAQIENEPNPSSIELFARKMSQGHYEVTRLLIERAGVRLMLDIDRE